MLKIHIVFAWSEEGVVDIGSGLYLSMGDGRGKMEDGKEDENEFFHR
jgi:hypothetical protein